MKLVKKIRKIREIYEFSSEKTHMKLKIDSKLN